MAEMSHLSHLHLLLFCLLTMGELKQAERSSRARTSLAQLPLERLLHVKQALETKGHERGDRDMLERDDEEERLYEERPLSPRTDLSRQKKKKGAEPSRRGDHWDEKGGKSKGEISSLFESTVTVLSFLAFGGYLLCLIVNAVKATPGGTSGGVVTMIPSPAPSAATATIIGKKRRRKRAVEEGMLRGLHRIAEAYAKYSLGTDEEV